MKAAEPTSVWRAGTAMRLAGMMLVMSPAAWAVDGTWTNKADGSWGVAGNWQGAVLPDNGHAYLTLTNLSYTVNYDAISAPVSNLVVSNRAPYQTTLVISSTLTNLGGAALRIAAGARVAVTNGGVWTYVGTNSATDRGESMFSIKNGGEVLVCGGAVTFTNIPRSTTSYGNNVNVGYQSTGTLNVASGRFDLWERSATVNPTHTLVVGRDTGGVGIMTLSGGMVVFGIQNAGDSPLFVGNNGGIGTLTVSGGTLLNTNTVYNWGYVGYNGGQGTLVVTNNGVIAASQTRLAVGVANRGNGVARFAGGSSTFNPVYVGYMKDAAGSSTGLVEVTAGTLTATGDLTVGHGEGGTDRFGRGQLDIGGGSTMCGGYYGLMVGYGRSGGTGTGSLTVTGGTLRVISVPDTTYSSGILIGHILENDSNAGTRSRGEALFSGGTVTNLGMFVVGGNGATGTVVQTSGSVETTFDARYLTVLGMGRGATSYFKAGYGTYTMHGGSYLTRNQTFVGGVPTNVLSNANAGSVGVLNLTGGTFTCSNTVYVGANGVGTLALSSNGLLRCNSLVLSNSTASTLQFDVGASGAGLVQINGALTIATGAKLAVNITRLPPTPWLRLVDCTSRTATFAPGDITVTSGGEIRQDVDEDIWLYTPRGTSVLIR